MMKSDTTALAQCGVWQISENHALKLDRPHLMGILNVTPDSFSDGGSYQSVDDAVNAAMRMHQEGAVIIDVGGESTRPGSHPVDADEQIRRTVPVIRALAKLKRQSQSGGREMFISIDTTLSAVAEAALDAGAHIINDISAGRDDSDMLRLAALRRCGLILMHRRTAPIKDSYSDQYADPPDYNGDAVAFVKQFLIDRCQAAIEAGVARESIVIDPGLGFGKSVEQSLELIRRTNEFTELGYPILSAASRKSFIGAMTGETDPTRRVFGSVAVSLLHFAAGVRLFRIHDVAAHRQALDVACAIHETCFGGARQGCQTSQPLNPHGS